MGNASYWRGNASYWRKECHLARAEIKRLTAERNDFYMDYRVKCDEETKAALTEIERLQALHLERTKLTHKALQDVERLTAELFAAELRAKTYEEGYNESQEAIRYHQAKVEALEGGYTQLQKFVDAQAEDVGLWCDAEYASEAYIQRGLRGCHAFIEQTIAATEQGESDE